MSSPTMTDSPAQPPAPRAPRGRDENAVEHRTLRDYYIIVRERLWIALPLALLVALPMGYYQMQETPMYESHTTLQFERPEKIVMVDQVVDQTPRSEIDINTYLERLNSASLRAKVIESFTPDEVKILQRPYLKDLPPGASPPPAGAALGSVSADAVRGSLIIVITARHRDPEAAALVANRYYKEFVDFLLEKSGGSNDDAVAFLQTARHGAAEGVHPKGGAPAGIQEGARPHLARRQPQHRHRPAEERERRAHRRPPRPARSRGRL